jgi:hypothetical protein
VLITLTDDEHPKMRLALFRKRPYLAIVRRNMNEAPVE